MSRLSPIVILLVAMIPCFVNAQEPADQVPLPKSPWKAMFARVTGIDKEKGLIEYQLARTVFATVTYTVTVPEAGADGKTRTRTETREKRVEQVAIETTTSPLADKILGTVAGKRVPLSKLPKSEALVGRDVIVVGGSEIDPYFLKFLDKEALLLLSTEERTDVAPLPSPLPAPAPVPVPAPAP